MGYTLEKLEGNKVKFTFDIPSADFDAAVQKAYLANRGSISIPGFRKGKAPRRLIESMYGEDVFYEEAVEKLFTNLYPEAVEAEKILPVSRPDVNVGDIKKGEDVQLICEAYVYPEVKLGKCEGVEIKRAVRTVGDDEVQHEIEHERKRVARSVDVTDRALQDGDTAELDYSGSVDGVKFEGGTAEHQTLVIGSNSFIPGFEEQMIGLGIGEERDLNVKFPDEYHSEELKGKDAVFHVKLHGITREELPEADDDFASEVSDFDTYAEYEADVRKKLQDAADERATEAAKQSLVQAVVDNAEMEVPPPMVDEKLDEMMRNMSWRMQRQGFSMEQYLKMLGQTEAQMREMYRSEALNNVKTELVIEQFIKEREIEADDSDVDALIESYASGAGQTAEQIKSSFGEEQMEYFKRHAKETKALDMLWNAAVVTDEEASADEPKDDSEPADDDKADE